MLEHDASVAYVDDDDDDDPSLPLYQTMPYVCGKVLLASVLDSLVAAVSSQCCISVDFVQSILFLFNTPVIMQLVTKLK